MGANSTQAQALILFLIAFIFIAGSFAANLNWLLMILGLVMMAAAIALFLKAKPWEQREG
jgi:1,4-dihydroxy-2-naphthoate octaprenyltransferase